VILPKAYIKHSTCITKVANWIEISIKELVDFYSKETAVESSYSIQWVYVLLQWEALWKYYDFTRWEIDRKMMRGEIEMNVIMLSKCRNHFFHKECVEVLVSSLYVKQYMKY
jgi:hypothetical protein